MSWYQRLVGVLRNIERCRYGNTLMLMMNWYMRSINVTTSHSCINTQIYLVLTHLNWFHLQIRTFSIEFVLLKIINLLILILILFSMKNMLEKIIFYLILIFFRIIIYYLNNSNSEDDLVSFMKPNNLDFSCIQILRSRFCSSSGPLKYSNFFFYLGWKISISKAKHEDELFFKRGWMM